eukprot:8824546-Ditylum_brightwellii.AAC.1
MDEVLRQQVNEFMEVLDAMRCGKMEECHVNFLLSRLPQDMPVDDFSKFENALHIMPTWKQVILITVEYIRSMNTPIAIIFGQYNSKKGTKRNHCVAKCSYSSLSGVGVGAVVMLLKITYMNSVLSMVVLMLSRKLCIRPRMVIGIEMISQPM